MHPTTEHALLAALARHPLLRFDVETTAEGEHHAIFHNGQRLVSRADGLWAQYEDQGSLHQLPAAGLDLWLLTRLRDQLDVDRRATELDLLLQEVRTAFPAWDWRLMSWRHGGRLEGTQGLSRLVVEYGVRVESVTLWLAEQRMAYFDGYDTPDPASLTECVQTVLGQGLALLNQVRCLRATEANALRAAWAPPSAEASTPTQLG